MIKLSNKSVKAYLLLTIAPLVQAMDTIHKAAKRGDVAVVQRFIDRDPSLVNRKDDDNFWTPLHYAASEGHVEVVRLLCNHPKIKINKQDRQGSTPLHWTANRCQNVEVIRFLCNHPKIKINKQNYRGETILLWATNGGCEEVVRLLILHGANPRLDSHDRETPRSSPVFKRVWDEILHANKQHVATALLMGFHRRAGTNCSFVDYIPAYLIQRIMGYLPLESFRPMLRR